MTKAEMKKLLLAKQRSIAEASRAAGNTHLTADEQKQWDALQAKIDVLGEISDEDREEAHV